MSDEPESRASLAEYMIGIAMALVATPGLIWWAITLVDVGQNTLEAFR